MFSKRIFYLRKEAPSLVQRLFEWLSYFMKKTVSDINFIDFKNFSNSAQASSPPTGKLCKMTSIYHFCHFHLYISSSFQYFAWFFLFSGKSTKEGNDFQLSNWLIKDERDAFVFHLNMRTDILQTFNASAITRSVL